MIACPGCYTHSEHIVHDAFNYGVETILGGQLQDIVVHEEIRFPPLVPFISLTPTYSHERSLVPNWDICS